MWLDRYDTDTNFQTIKNTTQLRETQSIELNQIIGVQEFHKKGVLNWLHWKYVYGFCEKKKIWKNGKTEIKASDFFLLRLFWFTFM